MTCLIVEFEHLAQSSSQPDLLASAGVSQVPLPHALPQPLGAVDEDQSPLLDGPVAVAPVCPRKRSSLCAGAAAEERNGASDDHQLPTAEEAATASKRARLEDALTAAAAVAPPPAVNDTR